MEGEVKEIQMELAAIKKDRLDLFNLKQSNTMLPAEDRNALVQIVPPSKTHEERFNKLQEVSKLREDLIRAKNAADEERLQREKYESKLKDMEQKLNNICSAGMVAEYRESKAVDNEVTSLKSQIRNMREEMEEMKMTVNERNEQLQDYRIKYLQAQQQVEELKRQLDVIEFDNKQVSDQIQIEIQKMKLQFQEKLQELAPLPDLLKGAQIQLQEAKQLQRLAEDSSQHLTNELHRVKEKLMLAVSSLNQEKMDKAQVVEENKMVKITLDEKNKELEELSKNAEEQKYYMLRLQEKMSNLEIRYTEKAAECTQLLKDLEDIRDESGRSVSRFKERADSTRRYLQTQISELERQLIQSRAMCKTCQKERDEIRQRMQIQINSLQENLELMEIRLRGLQNQVSSLKKSYSLILAEEEDNHEFVTITPVN